MSPFRKPIIRNFVLIIFAMSAVYLLPIGLFQDQWRLSAEVQEILFQLVAVFPILWLLLVHVTKKIDVAHLYPLHIRPFRWSGLLLVLILMIFASFSIDGLAILGLSYLAPGYVGNLLSEPILPPEPGFRMLTILLAVVLAPVMEEIVFRGLLLNRMMVKVGVQRAVIFSSLLFGLLHGEAFLGATLFGIVMCLLYLHSESLWAPTLVHIANNGIAVLISVYHFEPNSSDVLVDYRADFPYYLLALLAVPGIWFFLKQFWVHSMIFTPYEKQAALTTTISDDQGVD